MESSKIVLVLPNFFVLTCIFGLKSQKWVKTSFLRSVLKVNWSLTLLWRVWKWYSFSPISSSSSSLVVLSQKLPIKWLQEYTISWKLPYNVICRWRFQKMPLILKYDWFLTFLWHNFARCDWHLANYFLNISWTFVNKK